ncbi:TPA: hypothetical protein ACGOTH_001097 [Streptococcus suis]
MTKRIERMEYFKRLTLKKRKNLTFQSISLETKNGYISIQISDILAIDLEVEYESA